VLQSGRCAARYSKSRHGKLTVQAEHPLPRTFWWPSNIIRMAAPNDQRPSGQNSASQNTRSGLPPLRSPAPKRAISAGACASPPIKAV